MAVAPLRIEIGLSDRGSEQELVASYDAIKIVERRRESRAVQGNLVKPKSGTSEEQQERVEPPSAFRSTVVPGPRPST